MFGPYLDSNGRSEVLIHLMTHQVDAPASDPYDSFNIALYIPSSLLDTLRSIPLIHSHRYEGLEISFEKSRRTEQR